MSVRGVALRELAAAGGLFLSLAALSPASADPGDAAGHVSSEPLPVILWQRGARPEKPSGGPLSPGSNLLDHGGRILPASHVYTIWWGDPGRWPADAVTGLDALFSGVEGTSFLGIAGQYMRGGSIDSAYLPSNYADPSSPPTRKPRVSAIVAEACKVIGAHGLAADPAAIYFVFASTFPGGVNYCAWHSYGTCNGVTIQVAYMPNTTGIAGCDPGDLYSCNGYSQGTRSLANVASHELMEAITDPTLSAWYDPAGSEIGDKCAWQFSSCVSLTTGSFQLQEEWSNSAGGCVQQ
jgi:hypothetical protein